jgi:hypothetical protein
MPVPSQGHYGFHSFPVVLGPVMNICHNQQNGRVAHPTNCAKYYNCTDQSHPMLQECPYPFLYSPIHMSCQNFEYVQCHQRYEPKAPCEYKDHQNLNIHNNYMYLHIKEGIWISSLFTFIYTSKVTVVWLSCDWHAIFIWLVILLGMQYHCVIMKRKLTVMFNNSTNIGKTNTHPSNHGTYAESCKTLTDKMYIFKLFYFGCYKFFLP